GGTTLANVKAGVASTDAVNVGQLQSSGLIDDKGNAQKAVLFNGPAGEANVAGQRIVNVKAGTTGSDAVNVKQLTDAGINIDPTTGGVNNAFVAYDAADKGKVTLRGTGGSTLANVKAATANDQAVNLAQLKDAGIAVDGSGKVTNAFVAYDGADKRAVTLGGGSEGTTIHNVHAGSVNTDAVNVSQLRGIASTLGGGAAIGTDGKIQNPAYKLGDSTYNNVGDALDDLDRRTGENTVAIDDLKTGNGIKYFRANSQAADAAATGADSVAVGPASQAKGKSSTAIGAAARALGDDTAVLGVNAEATAASSTAVGGNALAGLAKAVALGNGARAEGEQSTVVGSGTVASGKNAAAIGFGASATAESALALGASARASHANAVAVGAGSVTSRANSVSVGTASQTRQITYVGAGTSDTDAVNLKQLKDAGIVVDGGGKVTNAFVSYDGADKAKVSLGGVGGTTLANVKAGVASTDAVNVGQLQSSGLIDDKGNAQKAVLFNGANGEANAAGTRLVNLAAGSSDTDGVNLKQLKDAGIAIDDGGKVTNAFVAYDGADKAKVSLGGVGGTTLANVKAGVASTDAVNVGQLQSSGLIDDKGNAQKAVLFNGANGAANAAGTRLVNLAAGSSDTDGVNLKQLKDAGIAVDDAGKVTNAFVAYDGADKTKVSLGGVGGTTLSNVKAGKADLDAVNVKQLKDSGIVDANGNAQKAVLFNGPNGEANAQGQRVVNVAPAIAATDAVNFGQLQSTGLVSTDGKILRGVSYAPGSVEAGAPLIVLEPGKGNSGYTDNGKPLPTGTRIQNVADGTVLTDAVNVGQMRAAVVGSNSDRGTSARSLEPRIATRAATRVAGSEDAVTARAYDTLNSYLRVYGRTDTKDTGYDDPSDKARVLDGGQTTGGIAQGSNALVEAERGIGIGMQAYVAKSASNGVALGTGSVANQANTVSVGSDGTQSYEAYDKNRQQMTIQNPAQTRRIVNMAAGQGDNDAVNISQLKQVTTAIGGGAAVASDGSVKAPTFNVGGKTYGNVGEALQAVDAIAATGSPLGISYDDANKAKVTLKGEGGTTLSNVKAGTADTDAVNVSQLKSTGLIDGKGNVVPVLTYDDASKSSVTLGGAGSTKPVSIKNVADAVADNEAVNLKQLKSAGLVDGNGSALDAVVYDSGSKKASVTFGGAQGTVLNNVADGQIAVGSRQAVNGGQIASLRDSLKGEIKGLDGRVTKLEGTDAKAGSGPYVSVQGPGPNATTGGNSDERSTGNGSVAVGAGSQALSPSSVAVGNGAQVREPAGNAVALGAGSVADRANSVSVGAQGKERTVTNVADGTRDTDAINRRQLEQVAKAANDHTDKRIDEAWGNVRRDMDDMNRQVNRGIAASAALVNVTPYLPGRTAVNAGVASYRGETALGVGVSRWSDNGRVNINAGISAAKNDEPIYRVGVGFVF
ncbi:MAG TPA: YadA-like family protein, partial [Stenotrophomonas sp.]|nr:YadA-like family protein [Stenotrophomonas sp.]